MKNITVAKINEVLFNLDPMNVGSVENNLVDEYYSISDNIAMLISRGITIRAAIKVEFEYSFWKDCISDKVIKNIINELNKFNIKVS